MRGVLIDDVDVLRHTSTYTMYDVKRQQNLLLRGILMVLPSI